MRFLFLSYIFPGPLGDIAQWLGRDRNNHVIFASSRFRQEASPENVQRALLKKYSRTAAAGSYLEFWEEALAAARGACGSLEIIRQNGFVPDMIFNASTNGLALGALQAFPQAFRINFVEEGFEEPVMGHMRGDLEKLQILDANLNFSFSGEAIKRLPPLLRPLVRAVPKMIDAEFFCRAAARPYAGLQFSDIDAELVMVLCSGEERECLKLCNELLKASPACVIVLVAANAHVLRKLQLLKAEPGQRLRIIPRPRRDFLRDLVCRSALCLYFGEKAEFLPAASCAVPCLVIGDGYLARPWEDTAERGRKGIEELVRDIVLYLADKNALARHGEACRNRVLRDHATSSLMPAFFEEILANWRLWKEGERRES